MSHQITVLALPHTSGTSVMGVVDLFAIANRIAERINDSPEPLFKLRVVSLDGLPMVCSNGYQVAVDGSVADISSSDIVYISAFTIATRSELEAAIPRWQVILPWLRQHGPDQNLIATSCSGSFLLAEAGLLDGQPATTAWWLAKYFVERYPEVRFDPDAICTVAENIVCGAATTSYQDVCLAVIERFGGKHFARLAAKYMMVDNQRRSQAPYAILSLIENDDKVVAKAEGWIRANLNQEFSIEQVADFAAVSPRTLIRRFQKNLGESPQSFTQKLRVEKCKTLLETTQLKFGEIVVRCGYSDESAFRRLFKRHCQLSPRDYRRRFNTATAD
ncbi:GlxA family transcriptional regulator [Oceanicoccus sp. KOV_DT_Chl]|uniref:GlxA family transcriptional regulator n=1 Tax=Oceanicoccus sp. KOV_DT_Chl TaxID=1904639 RepID=UPI0011AF43BC|nr:helix-turn-helix domain-containing protein [Oceanicoccus sp. KOV_DT_Chl]